MTDASSHERAANPVPITPDIAIVSPEVARLNRRMEIAKFLGVAAVITAGVIIAQALGVLPRGNP